MKVLPFKIPKSKNSALIYQEDKVSVFYNQLHQHEEIQLCTIVNGEGSLVVGDTITDYKKGDVLVIGSNLPHVFKSDVTNTKQSFMISLFFTKTSFGNDFFSLGDFAELQAFFNSSETGFKVVSDKTNILLLFNRLQKASNLERFILFLNILKLILSAKKTTLSTFIYQKKYSDNEGKRMSSIMDFTMNHFDKDNSLANIAAIANMTPNAFCRYFKQRTNKTYFQFLIEVRIENACRLLRNNELLIAEIAEKSGFKNISNFNRKFKTVKGISPSKYRKTH